MFNKNKIKKIVAEKNIINIDELKAYQVAYGKPLDYKDYFSYVGLPSISLFGLSFIVLYNWWYSLVFGIIGIIYGIKVILPKTVERNHSNNSFFQRNKFINNVTHILTDESITVQRALNTVIERASGEFKDDLKILQGQILATTERNVFEGIKQISEKYKKDIVFIQFMEQLETGIVEGDIDIDTLKDIKNYHNEVKDKQEYFSQMKEQDKSYMKKISLAMIAFVLIVNMFLGLDVYIDVFTKTPIGWVTGTIFLVLEMMYYRRFFEYYYDDSIMEVAI